ncbi:MAG: CarD family transcriptional regulator [Nocardioides sp.]
MATSSAHPRPRHASSPFQARPEPVVEQFEVGDRVCHDSHGLGRVIGIDGGGATVDFGTKLVRVETPFRKMTKL